MLLVCDFTEKEFIYLLLFGFLGMPGKGSYGAVYKARDKVTSELVAIKVISLSEGVCFLLPLSFLSCAFCLVTNLRLNSCH